MEAKKMTRSEMGYNKAKLVCSNCDESIRTEGKDYYECHKMTEEANWVQPHGFCDFHTTKIYEEISEKARSGYNNHG